MNVVMIGAGYVGLTTGACFASLGFNVCCIDNNEVRIRDLEAGKVPIFEPGLDDLIVESRRLGTLRFSRDLGLAVADADFVFIAVGTPSREDGGIDLSYVEAAARDVAPFIRDETIVVVKSTVVAGTARSVRKIIEAGRRGRRSLVASNPEFLREGSAIDDFMNADRIVIGTDERETGEKLKALYRPLIERGVPLVSTSTTDAELIKYAANAFLALKIGFINDVADICQGAGADVMTVAEGIGLDRRIGRSFLAPGPGFGGSCFPKDTRAFAATGREFNAPQTLIETLIARNEQRKTDLGSRILEEIGSQGRGSHVAVLGAAFKANTDDIREAAALTIIPLLQQAGVTVSGHDPKAQAAAQRLLQDVMWHDDLYATVKGVDAVVILTEWDDYRHMDIGRVARLMRGRHLFDYRNLFLPSAVIRHDLVHHSLGRPRSEGAPSASVGAPSGGHAGWTDMAAMPVRYRSTR